MPYYDTIEEDIVRAKQIIAEGKPAHDEVAYLPEAIRAQALSGGTIYGKDTYAAYKLLVSFVEEIARLNLELNKYRVQDLYNNPALYDVARKVMHEAGFPWTDPRTGITHPPPEQP